MPRKKSSEPKKVRTRKTKAKPKKATEKVSRKKTAKKEIYFEVDDEFREDKDKMKVFKKMLENGELKWVYFAVVGDRSIQYYLKVKNISII